MQFAFGDPWLATPWLSIPIHHLFQTFSKSFVPINQASNYPVLYHDHQPYPNIIPSEHFCACLFLDKVAASGENCSLLEALVSLDFHDTRFFKFLSYFCPLLDLRRLFLLHLCSAYLCVGMPHSINMLNMQIFKWVDK